MITTEMILWFVGIALTMFLGCGYWLYRVNDTITWKQACQPSSRKENPIDLY